MASTSAARLYVKQASGGTGLGDCPFCHKANMALRLKSYPFEYEMIDLANKPESYLKLNEKGTVPTFINSDGSILTESDDIVKLADSNSHGPKLLGFPEMDEAGSLAMAVWKATATMLKNKDESAAEPLNKEFHTAMAALESFKKSKTSKFLISDEPSAADCKAAPFLLHAHVTLPHYKKMDPIFDQYPALKAYFAELEALPAFKDSSYPADVIIAGWNVKLI